MSIPLAQNPAPSSSAKRRPKILVLQATSLFEQYGGIEYYLDDLLTTAAELYGARHITSLIPQRKERLTALVRPYQTHFVRFSKYRGLRKLQNRFSLNYFFHGLKLIEQLEPSFILNSHVSLGPIAFALHKLKKIPYLTCIYGIEAWGNLWPQDEWCLKQSDGIISISRWTKDVLVRRGYLPGKIELVHPRLPTAYEGATPASNLQRVFTLLTVSRLDAREQYKGHDHVLLALDKIRRTENKLKIRYIIHGDGSGRRRLENLVRELGLQGIVEFRPAVENRDVLKDLYTQADVFIMPSRFGRWEGKWRGEGFGIVYLEAAACGLPSIAYGCGGATDVIEHEVNGLLVKPDNIDELAGAIVKMAKNREAVIKMGLKAREIVLSKFTESATRRELAKAVEKFLGD